MTLTESPALSRNLNFLALWFSQVFSQIADKIYLIFTITLISQKLFAPDVEISPLVTGIMVAFTVPAILFGSLAGVFIDRWSKKAVMIASNLLRGGLILILPATIDSLGRGINSYWALLVVTFLISTLTQFFTPAEQSAIALVVEKEQLLTANSVYATTVMGALILGFALGKPALALAEDWLGTWGEEILVGGCYTIAGIILGILVTGERLQDRLEYHIWQDLLEGIGYVKTQPIIQGALVQLVTTYSVIAALTVLAVQIAEVLPQLHSDDFGYLLSVSSVGIALAAAILGRFRHLLPYQRSIAVGTMGMVLALGGLTLSTQKLIPALIMIATIGICAGLCVIPMQTIMQEKTPEQLRGKVFGLQNNLVNLALSLPLALAGFAESSLGIQPVLVGLSIFALSGGSISLCLMQSEGE